MKSTSFDKNIVKGILPRTPPGFLHHRFIFHFFRKETAMAHALQHHQRERLREALLLAGLTEEDGELPFVVGNVQIGDPYIVAFCKTPGHARVHGFCAIDNIDPDEYSDALLGNPDLPATPGIYSAIGTVRISRPAKVGKPTLLITILRYVPTDEAEQALQTLLQQRTLPDTSQTPAVSEESRRQELVLS